jgi:hypothetical protein
MEKTVTTNFYTARLIYGFISGFFATLIFHQLMLALLHYLSIAPFGPFSMTATSPFGVPSVISLSFWGGVWGIVYAMLDIRFPGDFRYWITAFSFGAIFPSLVALLIVFPLKGLPFAGGWKPMILLTVFLVNGAWGVGTGVFMKTMSGFHKNLVKMRTAKTA